jgi:xanthine/CO dehydrogenase XdhC/CoxF family maturation factor
VGDLASISEALAPLIAEGASFTLATVVATSGSTYRRPGARAIVLDDGSVIGALSGGCLEEEVAAAAREVSSAPPRMVVFDHSDPDERHLGWGMGCPGRVEILLEGPDTARSLSTLLRDALAGDDPVQIATDLATAEHVAGPRAGWFVETIDPPPTLVACGGGPEAGPLRRAAASLRWRFEDAASPESLPGGASRSLALVCSHNFDRDRAFVDALVASGAAYIGIIGPRSRAEELLNGMDANAPIHAPAGLDIGAESPDEIALAVIAEMLAYWNGREGGPLSGRDAPIH